jgi:hypothetical protein
MEKVLFGCASSNKYSMKFTDRRKNCEVGTEWLLKEQNAVMFYAW